VSTSSSAARVFGSPRRPSRNERVFPGRQFRASNAAPRRTWGLMSLSGSAPHWRPQSPSSLLPWTRVQPTMPKSRAEQQRPTTITSTLMLSSQQWKKRRDQLSSATPAPADRPWRVSFHPQVAKVISNYGLDNTVFRPTLGELHKALQSNPKQFEKKRGTLRDLRSAALSYADGIAWRAVFSLDEGARIVRVRSIAPHDVAYKEAKNRS